MRTAVFLDRDGVINRNMVRDNRSYAPEFIDDFEILPGVAEAVSAFRAAGHLVIVATNQPDVGAGRQQREVVERMHAIVRAELAVDDIMVCFHTDVENCSCRKPKPGMLLSAAEKYAIELPRSWMIGDRWRDIGAGRAVGCRTIFIDYGFAEQRPQSPSVVVRSLAEAVPHILRRHEEFG